MLFKVDPDPRKEFEVDPDPDLDPVRGSKWIRIRPNVVDPGGSGSGSETLNFRIYDKKIGQAELGNVKDVNRHRIIEGSLQS